ncbi:MAG: hypothetical protein IJH12_07755 [Clostridia bacterium]|nr:hypothetical protein [Clostridia bacterium]
MNKKVPVKPLSFSPFRAVFDDEETGFFRVRYNCQVDYRPLSIAFFLVDVHLCCCHVCSYEEAALVTHTPKAIVYITIAVKYVLQVVVVVDFRLSISFHEYYLR